MSYHVCLNRHGDSQTPDLANIELLYDFRIFFTHCLKRWTFEIDGFHNYINKINKTKKIYN